MRIKASEELTVATRWTFTTRMLRGAKGEIGRLCRLSSSCPSVAPGAALSYGAAEAKFQIHGRRFLLLGRCRSVHLQRNCQIRLSEYAKGEGGFVAMDDCDSGTQL